MTLEEFNAGTPPAVPPSAADERDAIVAWLRKTVEEYRVCAKSWADREVYGAAQYYAAKSHAVLVCVSCIEGGRHVRA